MPGVAPSLLRARRGEGRGKERGLALAIDLLLARQHDLVL